MAKKKSKPVEKIRLSGRNIYTDKKGRVIFYDMITKKGYLVDKKHENSALFFKNRFVVLLFAAILFGATFLTWLQAAVAWAVMMAIAEFAFRRGFLKKLEVVNDVDFERRVSALQYIVENKAKGKVIKQIGWKLYEECFKNDDGLAIENPADAGKDHIPKVEVDHKFYNVSAAKTEHFTAPPKPYSEDTLLAAMETAGNKEFDEDTEKKGLGTPATRAAIIEKLIQSGFVKREKKNLVPTDDGNVLITVLPDEIKSPKMTAEWEMALNHIAQNTETADEFLNGITELMQELVARYQGISEEKKNQFQGKAKGEVIGKCPRCGADVREGKVNFYCSDRKCAFTLWKNDKFLASQGKKMDKVAAKKFLSKGKIHYKDLVSRKTGRQYEATVEMVDPGEGNVQFNLIFPQR